MLPIIDYPTTLIKVPSLKKSFKFRPFKVKEEKILLMAKESKDPADILSAIRQVIANCSADEKLDLDKITIFDLEYIFIKIRAMSVDSIASVSYIDQEDNKKYDFEVDLNSVEVEFPENVSTKIEINKTKGVLMRYPSATLYDDKEFLGSGEDYVFELIVRCVDKIYDGDDVYEAKDYPLDEIRRFLDALDIKSFDKIREFLINLPKLKHVIKYTNSLGNEKEIELNSLNDFFTLR